MSPPSAAPRPSASTRTVGSLEPGKRADLQILDANPLTDTRNTNTIKMVMKNGELYEAEP